MYIKEISIDILKSCMQLRFIKFVFTFLLMCTTVIYCLALDKLNAKDKNVKLITWKSFPCDKRYEPYRIINRITSKRTQGDTTYITVNFADNRCAVFKPRIFFSDTSLLLFPYEKYIGEKCDEDCTFSIEFVISGVSEKKYDIYFKEKKIELLSNHYSVVEPKDTLYKGEKINRINKYGFKEGIHMTFYETGETKGIWKFPDVVEYYQDFIWCKGYYRSGKIYYHTRNDTSQTWFEDGVIKSQHIKYVIGDTLYIEWFNQCEDREKTNQSIERVITIFNPKGEVVDYKTETLYNEQYYSCGQIHFLYKSDTLHCWYENGQLSYKENASYKVSYTKEGIEEYRWYRWTENATGKWKDIKRLLYIKLYENGNIKEINFEKRERNSHGKKVKKNYYWMWDSEKKLIESPGKLKEEYPWKKFGEINLLLKNYELH